ncbi:hypothetical protein, variant [Saprolegnia diclina VS20]|uniref:TOG domain-containing protein n=1 Tax=Saprolegnia diclina (strain VS20) TaxID=1156394 RepID=T0RZ09_SAPDV|nr:hypothetical protein, variant [Saprolegnia diclina VS20]EQC35542.1 hypothetical protein, variant [Saprolegnia diclina VS20]|eukprot:XP_008610859.1 hypothetical protein, variant [Saprolegnia diclina VS20]
MQPTLGWRSKQCPLDGYAARLRVGDEEWKLKVDALRDIHSYVVANAGSITQENLSCLVVPFRSLFVELRSAVVKEACEVFAEIAVHLGQKTKLLISNVFSTMIDARGGTNKVNSSAIHGCIERVLKVVMSRHILSTFFYVSKTSKNGQMRDACVQYMLILLKHWTFAHLDTYRGQIQDFIASALSDASPVSRDAGRSCYAAYASIWPDYKDAFLMTLEPSVKKHLARQLEVVTVNAHAISPHGARATTDIVTPRNHKRKTLSNITNTPDTIKRRRNLAVAKVQTGAARRVSAHPQQSPSVENVAAPSLAVAAPVATPHSNHETLKKLYFELLCEKKATEKKLHALQTKFVINADALARAEEKIEGFQMQTEDAPTSVQSSLSANDPDVMALHETVATLKAKLKEKENAILRLELNFDESQTALKQTSVMLKEYNTAKEEEISALKAQVSAMEIQSSLQESPKEPAGDDPRVAELQARVDELVKQKATMEEELGCMDETMSTVQAGLFEEQQQGELLKAELAQLKASSSTCECQTEIACLKDQLQVQLTHEHALREKHRAVEEQATTLKAEMLKLKTEGLDTHDADIRTVRDENAALTNQLVELRASVRVLETQNAAWASERQALVDGSNHQATESQERVTRLEAELTEARLEFTTLSGNKAQLVSMLEDCQAKLDDATTRVDDKSALVELYKANMEQQGSIGAGLAQEIVVIKDEKRDLEADNEKLRAQIVALTEALSLLETKAAAIDASRQAEHDALVLYLQKATDESAQLQATLAVTTEERDEVEERAKGLTADVVELQDRVQDLSSEIRCLQVCLETTEKEKSELEMTVSAQEQQILALQEDDFQRQCRYDDTVKDKAASIALLERQVDELRNQVGSLQAQNSDLQLQCEAFETRAFVSSKEREDQAAKWVADQTALLSEKGDLVLANTRLAKDNADLKASVDARVLTIGDLETHVAKLEATLAQWHEQDAAWAKKKLELDARIDELSQTCSRHEEALASTQTSLIAAESALAGLNAERSACDEENKKLQHRYDAMERALEEAEAKKVYFQQQVLAGFERLRETKLEKGCAEPKEIVTTLDEPAPETPSPVHVVAPVQPARRIDVSWKQTVAASAPSLFQPRPSKANIKAQRQLNDANLLKRFQSAPLP